ncbi:uncharacterized protein LOC141630737 [Silene latifolia]|uniref:uncharacterized protein LOC141630737 n=1 Tax=Silene latifolia TaxID=37657 RepID=UPI003D76D78E
MIISSWNVRGMNDPLKQQEVLEFLKRNRVDCGALIETHIKVDVARVIHKRKFSSYAMESNYSNHSGGRIWVIWNPAVAHVQSTREDGVMGFFTNALATQTLPWICLGDFNVSLYVDERVGCMVHDRDMQDFRDCLSFCSLVDHPYTGGIYTWHNNHAASPKWAKLDRLLLSPLNHLLIAQEKTALLQYVTLKKAEMRVLAQRAKIHHLQQSDDNTKYFYAQIAAKKCRNTIGSIQDVDGSLCQGHAQVSQAFLHYYQYLLGSIEDVLSLPSSLFTHGTI